MSSTSYAIVDTFEKTIAEYAGAKYAVAVESCCAALFLCVKYVGLKTFTIPRQTYPGVACAIINAGARVNFRKLKWEGVYDLFPSRIIDGALRFKKGMYKPLGSNTFHCLSFHAKKHLPIGRGGMILTNNHFAYQWFKKARFDGRSEKPLDQDKIEMVGWNMYMTPEQAARGLMLFEAIKDKKLEDIDPATQNYPDLSKIDCYQCLK